MNYYNDSDPAAAAWLRQLISMGLIPNGDVDERSIADVRGSELADYTQCHWFAGIAGWPEALRLANYPDTARVWTGSCPCQPYSIAGRQQKEKDKRHLWPELRRLISECSPERVFGEQVASAAGRDWLSGVRTDLEGLGYAVGAADLCAAGCGEKDRPEILEAKKWLEWEADRRDACGDNLSAWRLRHLAGGLAGIIVGAPHIRQRLYWGAVRVAEAGKQRRQQIGRGSSGYEKENGREGWDGREPNLYNQPSGDGATGRLEIADIRIGELEPGNRTGPIQEAEPRSYVGPSRPGSADRLDNAPESRRAGQRIGGAPAAARDDSRLPESSGRGASELGGLADNEDAERQFPGYSRQWGSGLANNRPIGGLAVPDGSESGRELRQQSPDGGADSGLEPGAGQGPEGFWSDFRIIPCLDGKARRTERGIFPLVNGIQEGMVPGGDTSPSINANETKEARLMRLRGFGNAIVPQLAAVFIQEFLGAIEDLL